MRATSDELAKLTDGRPLEQMLLLTASMKMTSMAKVAGVATALATVLTVNVARADHVTVSTSSSQISTAGRSATDYSPLTGLQRAMCFGAGIALAAACHVGIAVAATRRATTPTAQPDQRTDIQSLILPQSHRPREA